MNTACILFVIGESLSARFLNGSKKLDIFCPSGAKKLVILSPIPPILATFLTNVSILDTAFSPNALPKSSTFNAPLSNLFVRLEPYSVYR